ncbi:MAG: O-antigen ligase family protein [Pyrinomonadaceae bacterium]
MSRYTVYLDTLAETNNIAGAALFFRRTAFVFLLVMAAAAPHSIAATQTAWLIGMTSWIIGLFFGPAQKLKFGFPGRLLAAFFIWSAVSSALSYEPYVSIDKLRGVSVFLIFPYVLNVVRNKKAVYLCAAILLCSALISSAWTPVQKIIGRGIEVHNLNPDGILAAKGLADGDTILAVNGVKTTHPEEVLRQIETAGFGRIDVYRTDAPFTVTVKSDEIPAGPESANQRLGFESFNRSSNFRAAGFYGHYTTFAESLQLIASLCLGLLIAALRGGADRKIIAALAGAILLFLLALLLTVTRGSQAAFLLSAFTMVAFGGGKRFFISALAIALPIALVGLLILHGQRGVGFADSRDGSIQYRQMMWRDGIRLLTESRRNLFYGVGMDSIKTHWSEWGLFDKGWQPMGHFHSTPIQIAVERGLPALLIWLAVIGVFARKLWCGIRSAPIEEWASRGILLGCFGGLLGFFAGGFVHYNLGDTEVAMIFYFLMGISVRLADEMNEKKTV